jgi:hypothetical protein
MKGLPALALILFSGTAPAAEPAISFEGIRIGIPPGITAEFYIGGPPFFEGSNVEDVLVDLGPRTGPIPTYVQISVAPSAKVPIQPCMERALKDTEERNNIFDASPLEAMNINGAGSLKVKWTSMNAGDYLNGVVYCVSRGDKLWLLRLTGPGDEPNARVKAMIAAIQNATFVEPR